MYILQGEEYQSITMEVNFFISGIKERHLCKS